jgi:predicted site-specific integrase-resolvase
MLVPMTNTPPVETLISVPEVARRLDMPIRTAYRWVYAGHLTSKQDPFTKRIWVDAASVADVAARRVLVP